MSSTTLTTTVPRGRSTTSAPSATTDVPTPIPLGGGAAAARVLSAVATVAVVLATVALPSHLGGVNGLLLHAQSIAVAAWMPHDRVCYTRDIRESALASDWVLSPVGAAAESRSDDPGWRATANGWLIIGVVVVHGAICLMVRFFAPDAPISHCFFPNVSMAVMVALVQGSVFYATAAWMETGPTANAAWPSAATVTVVVVAVIPMVAAVMVIRWYRCTDETVPTPAAAGSSDSDAIPSHSLTLVMNDGDGAVAPAASWPERFFARFTPATVWRPQIAVNCFGVLFASFRYPFRYYELCLICLNVALAAIVGAVQRCDVKLGLVLAIWLLEGLMYAVLRPMRLRIIEICCVMVAILHAVEVLMVLLAMRRPVDEAVDASQADRRFGDVAMGFRMLALSATLCFAISCLLAFVADRKGALYRRRPSALSTVPMSTTAEATQDTRESIGPGESGRVASDTTLPAHSRASVPSVVNSASTPSFSSRRMQRSIDDRVASAHEGTPLVAPPPQRQSSRRFAMASAEAP